MKFNVKIAAALLCLGSVYAGAKSSGYASYYTPDYLDFKKKILTEFRSTAPGRFGEFVGRGRAEKGIDQKVIALTFDACGGNDGYNKPLIDYLRAEKIPATLFVTGLWADKHKDILVELAKEPLFEIENHGLLHRLCSTEGRMMYGVRSTTGLGGVIDEMELGARRIEELTGRRPIFFRSATAYTDDLSRKVAARLGMEVVSYDILSGDARGDSAKKMSRSILSGARHGAVIILHFNHPEWPELEALKLFVPELRKRGFNFARLDSFTLKP
jgi:peptidoglycan/xylan/chitin deacetylase (PgdA/CDA1 family)